MLADNGRYDTFPRGRAPARPMNPEMGQEMLVKFKRRGRSLMVGLLALWAMAPATAAESELSTRWLGAWVVIGVPTYSHCGGSYTDNEVRGTLVTSKGNHAFGKGEMGRVHKIDFGKKKAEVLIDLAEPVLVARSEGPFTLYELKDCKIELQIDLPKLDGKQDVDQVDQWVLSLLERHSAMVGAQASSLWNERVRDPFPDDYDVTLAEYEEWKTEQLQAEIADQLASYSKEAARIVDRLDVDAESLAGFGKGVDDARDRGFSEQCDRLVDLSVGSFTRSGSSSASANWREGYRDGQELVFYLEMIARLLRCRGD